jgi:hypothetical protein
MFCILTEDLTLRIYLLRIKMSEMLQEFANWDMGLWGRLAGSNVYCASTDPADLWTKAELQEQRVSPYMPLQAGYRSKNQSSTHIWLHVTSLAFHFPSAMWPACFNSLSFIYLLCHLLPLSHCQNTSLSVSFLASPFLLQWQWWSSGHRAPAMRCRSWDMLGAGVAVGCLTPGATSCQSQCIGWWQ